MTPVEYTSHFLIQAVETLFAAFFVVQDTALVDQSYHSDDVNQREKNQNDGFPRLPFILWNLGVVQLLH